VDAAPATVIINDSSRIACPEWQWLKRTIHAVHDKLQAFRKPLEFRIMGGAGFGKEGRGATPRRRLRLTAVY
jgi:hypothetical protein